MAGGLREYHEERSARAQARNLADLHTLEGPGSEARMRELQAKFRRLNGAPRQRLPLPLLFLLTFAAVFVVGWVLQAL